MIYGISDAARNSLVLEKIFSILDKSAVIFIYF